MRLDNLLVHYTHDHLPAARSAIGDVLDACRDGVLGYALAARLVRDERLQDLFRELADQRSDFARALERHSLWLGAPPDAAPGVGGAIHRKWMALRGEIDHGAAAAYVAECERGEHSALEKYDHALRIPMPEELRLDLLTQRAQIAALHDRLDSMLGRSRG